MLSRDYYEYQAKYNRNTDILGEKEIGGVGQLVYHLIRFGEYKFEFDANGNQIVLPDFQEKKMPDTKGQNTCTGKEILMSLCNLAKQVDDFDNEIPCKDLIIDWCRKYSHPYNIDFIHSEINDKNFDIATDYFLLEKDGRFTIDEFMQDLGKLYNAMRFYMALEGVFVGEENNAYKLYSQGRFFEGLPFFEKYKYFLPKMDIDYSSAKGDLLKEMQLESEYLEAHPMEELPEGVFAQEPFDDYERLRDALMDIIPDFKMRLKLDAASNKMVFSADINSVFNLAWYTLARMLTEDVVPEEKGSEPERPEGVMICCRKCGDFFIRKSNRQEFCTKPECQKTRNAKNQQNFRNRKKLENR